MPRGERPLLASPALIASAASFAAGRLPSGMALSALPAPCGGGLAAGDGGTPSPRSVPQGSLVGLGPMETHSGSTRRARARPPHSGGGPEGSAWSI